MDLAANLKTVQQRIEAACARAGRDPVSVTLVAVTKTRPPEVVCAAAELGLSLFGENKVQEAKAKIPLCPGRLRWHMIGHLQTNKCRDAVGLFEMVQSVDSLRLAEELQPARRAGGENNAGVAGGQRRRGGQQVRDAARTNSWRTSAASTRLPRLEIHGLMTVPPWTLDPEKVRPVFRQMRELKAALRATARRAAPT